MSLDFSLGPKTQKYSAKGSVCFRYNATPNPSTETNSYRGTPFTYTVYGDMPDEQYFSGGVNLGVADTTSGISVKRVDVLLLDPWATSEFDDYGLRPEAVAVGHWHWRVDFVASMTREVVNEAQDPLEVVIASFYYNAHTLERSLWSIDTSFTYELSISGEFERHVYLTDIPYNGKSDLIWKGYAGRDPNGIYPANTTICYVPKNNCTWEWNLNGTIASASRSNLSTWHTGIWGWSGVSIQFGCYLLERNVAHDQSIWLLGEVLWATGAIYFDDTKQCTSEVFEGDDQVDWNDEYNPYNTRMTLFEGVAKFYTDIIPGDQGNATQPWNTGCYDVICPSHDVSYGVVTKNLDASLVNCACHMDESVSGYANGTPLVKHFDGRWKFGWFSPGSSPTPMGKSYSFNDIRTPDTLQENTAPEYNTDNAMVHFIGGAITNMYDVGQPIFGVDGVDGETGFENPLKYQDSKLEAAVSYFEWPSAVTFAAPTANKEIIHFADFTWTPSTGVTLSVESGKIKAVVASDATSPRISKAFTTKSFQGGRYIQLDYTSNDESDEPITLEITGRRWAVNNTQTRGNIVDSITPNNLPSGGNGTNTLFDQATSPIGTLWTIRQPGTVAVELKPGRTYYLESLSLTRAEESKRSVTTRVFRGTFIGDHSGDSRENDTTLGGLMSKPDAGDMECNPNPLVPTAVSQERQRVRSRQGIIFVDDAPDCEIYGMEHYNSPITVDSVVQNHWHHDPIPMSSAKFISPYWVSGSGNYLDYAFATDAIVTGQEWKQWKSADLPAVFLAEGADSGMDSTSIDWQPLITKFTRPFGELSPITGYGITKWLSGDALVRAINSDGSPLTSVVLKQYDDWSSTPFRTDIITVGADGWAYLHSLKQPTTTSNNTAIPYRYELVAGSTTLSFAMRNRNTTILLLIPGQSGIGILYKGSVAGQPLLFKASATGQPILYLD